MTSQQQGSKASVIGLPPNRGNGSYGRSPELHRSAATHWEREGQHSTEGIVGIHLISPQESVTGRSDPTGISKEIDMEIHDPEKSPASDKLTDWRTRIYWSRLQRNSRNDDWRHCGAADHGRSRSPSPAVWFRGQRPRPGLRRLHRHTC